MKRRRSATAALLALSVMSSLAAIEGAHPAAAAMGDVTPVASRAFSELASCAANADVVLASVVVDESGSLRSTDPTDQRVGAITTAIDTLESLRSSAAGSVDVQASLSTFAEGYQSLVSWGPLDADHAGRMRSSVSDQLPSRDRGRLTDYRQALQGAERELAQRAAEVGGTSCKVVLWFTDGGLDVGKDSAAALGELCSPQGIVDNLRASDVTVIALALFTETGAGSVSAEQREQLRAVAEGSGEGTTCGTSPIPSDAAAGAYLRADNAAALRRLFAGTGALIAGGVHSVTEACPSTVCIDGQLGFPVDAGIMGARIIVEASSGDARPVLVSPAGEEHVLVAGSGAISGGTLDVSERDGLTVASLTFESPSGPQIGSWSVRSVDAANTPTESIVDIYYHWGADLSFDAPDGLMIGESSSFTVALTGNGGDPLPLDLYDEVTVDASVGDQAIELREGPNGTLEGTVDLTASGVPSTLPVTITAKATTIDSGIALGPITSTGDLPTTVPPSYPSVSPTRLELPGLEGPGTTEGSLHLAGSDRGPTRACMAGSEVRGPNGAEGLALEAERTCIDIPANGEVDWAFTFSAETVREGRVDGEMRITLTSAGTDPEIEVAVPVSLKLRVPVDQPLRAMLVLILVGASLLLPLLMLFLANWWISRYHITPLTRAASAPVIVDAGGLRTRKPDGGALIDADDFTAIGEAKVTRPASFSAHGVRFGRTLPWWPLNSSRAVASPASPHELIISGTGNYSDSKGMRAPVAFGLATSWLLLIDPATLTDEQAHGRLVFVNDDTGLRDLIEARIGQLESFPGWETLWARLGAAQKARAAAAKLPAEPSPQSSPPRGAPVPVPVPEDPRDHGGPPPSGLWDEPLEFDAPPAPTSAPRRADALTTAPTTHDDDFPPPPPPSF